MSTGIPPILDAIARQQPLADINPMQLYQDSQDTEQHRKARRAQAQRLRRAAQSAEQRAAVAAADAARHAAARCSTHVALCSASHSRWPGPCNRRSLQLAGVSCSKLLPPNHSSGLSFENLGNRVLHRCQ